MIQKIQLIINQEADMHDNSTYVLHIAPQTFISKTNDLKNISKTTILDITGCLTNLD